MKTREQAEARALDKLNEYAKELGYYHWEHFLKDHDTPEKLFEAGVEYAKQQDKQTCGFCVNKKSLHLSP